MRIFSWFSSARYPEEPRWLRRWVLLRPGRRDAKVEAIKRAAAADVAAMEAESREYFRQDGPGDREDDL